MTTSPRYFSNSDACQPVFRLSLHAWDHNSQSSSIVVEQMAPFCKATAGQALLDLQFTMTFSSNLLSSFVDSYILVYQTYQVSCIARKSHASQRHLTLSLFHSPKQVISHAFVIRSCEPIYADSSTYVLSYQSSLLNGSAEVDSY